MKAFQVLRPVAILGMIGVLGAVGAGSVLADAVTPTVAPTATSTSVPVKHHAYTGTIKSMAANSFVLTTKAKGDVTITVNADTKYHVPGVKDATWANFKVGDRATTMVTESNGTNTASHVNLIPAKPIHVVRTGTITAYTAGSSITIKDKKGDSSTFVINSDTKIQFRHGTTVVHVGDRATVSARRDPASDTYTAKHILDFGAPKTPKGPKS